MRVGMPVSYQIGTADLGVVTERDERGQAASVAGRVFQYGNPDRGGPGDQRESAGPRRDRRKAGVELYPRIGVDHTETVRAEHAHAVLAGDSPGPCSRRPVRRSGGGPGPGEHDRATDTAAARFAQHLRDMIGWGRDDQQVDWLGQVGDRAVARDTEDRPARAVDRIQPTAVPEVAQSTHHLKAGAAMTLHGADHRHRRRRQQRAQADLFPTLQAAAANRDGGGRHRHRHSPPVPIPPASPPPRRNGRAKGPDSSRKAALDAWCAGEKRRAW
jgi:hypothetical protein